MLADEGGGAKVAAKGAALPGNGMAPAVSPPAPGRAPTPGATAPGSGMEAVALRPPVAAAAEGAAKSRSRPALPPGIASPTRVASSSFSPTAAGRAALMPGSGTAAVGFVVGRAAGTFDGGATPREAPGMAGAAVVAEAPGSGIETSAPAIGVGSRAAARVGSSFQLVGWGFAADSEGRETAPPDGAGGLVAAARAAASCGTARVGSSSQLVGWALGAEMPGRGTAPLADEGRAAPGSATWSCGTARVGSSSQLVGWALGAEMPGRGTALLAGAAAPGFTGNTFWHVGHLMRAPPGGIFLSSMVRLALHDGQATFMRLLGSREGANSTGAARYPGGWGR